MDWKALKSKFIDECCTGFHESHFMGHYYRINKDADSVFDWFRNKLDTDTFCLICNEWHPEGECMRIKPVKEDSWVSTGTVDDWVVDVLEEGVDGYK